MENSINKLGKKINNPFPFEKTVNIVKIKPNKKNIHFSLLEINTKVTNAKNKTINADNPAIAQKVISWSASWKKKSVITK